MTEILQMLKALGCTVQCLQSLMAHTSAVKCLSSRVGVV